MTHFTCGISCHLCNHPGKEQVSQRRRHAQGDPRAHRPHGLESSKASLTTSALFYLSLKKERNKDQLFTNQIEDNRVILHRTMALDTCDKTPTNHTPTGLKS